MRLLLDTHALIYAIDKPEQLPPRLAGLLLDTEVERWVSTVSIWEIVTKVRIGKLSLPTGRSYYDSNLRALNAQVLPLEMRHSMELFHLPLHHRDPFDRMLIAQARVEGLTLVSDDRLFEGYEVDRIW